MEDLAILESVGPASGYMAVLVLALYVNSDLAVRLYERPFLLWLVCPLILYWLTRVWFLARRGVLSEDPLLFSLKDRTSLAVAGLTVVMVLLASGQKVAAGAEGTRVEETRGQEDKGTRGAS